MPNVSFTKELCLVKLIASLKLWGRGFKFLDCSLLEISTELVLFGGGNLNLLVIPGKSKMIWFCPQNWKKNTNFDSQKRGSQIFKLFSKKV